jgi:TolB-like protein
MVAAGHGVAVASTLMRHPYQPAAHPIARIHLLGPMRATSYLGDDILPRAKKARAVLACLCLAAGGKFLRARLAAMLWEKSSDEQARSSLRQALADITAAMGPLAAELISGGRAHIRLDANACWIDLLALMDQSSDDAVRSDLARHCTGTLLEGFDGISGSFDLWLSAQRARFSERLRSLRFRSRAVPNFSDVKSAPAAVPQDYPHRPLPGRNRLRVAVLPFDGRGAREENLASSLSHEIAAALARFRWFDVISPASVFRPVSSDDLLRQQLDYAVDGVLSRRRELLQIGVRLLDLTRSTQPVWTERFELPTGELHRLNDMVTPRVVGSIDPVILFIEGQPKRREHYGATGILLLAIPLLYSMERNKFQQAGDLISRALKIDPQNAMALAWSAIWHITRAGHGWTQDFATELAEA